MATKNNPGKFDCYANAEPDEPMFILLGRDKHAPTLVWLWATLRELDGEDAAKVADARACAAHMLHWQREHDRKAVGLGQATLAGVFELIRTANYGAKADGSANNAETTKDIVRRYLGATQFEQPKQAEG